MSKETNVNMSDISVNHLSRKKKHSGLSNRITIIWTLFVTKRIKKNLENILFNKSFFQDNLNKQIEEINHDLALILKIGIVTFKLLYSIFCIYTREYT